MVVARILSSALVSAWPATVSLTPLAISAGFSSACTGQVFLLLSGAFKRNADAPPCPRTSLTTSTEVLAGAPEESAHVHPRRLSWMRRSTMFNSWGLPSMACTFALVFNLRWTEVATPSCP